MRTVSLNQFDGGITNDPRDPAQNVARMVTNFDILTDAHRMRPYRSSESGDTASTTSQKQNFAVAKGASYALYSLGVKSGLNTAEVKVKVLSTDLADGVWGTPSNNQSAAGSATSFNLFVYYQKVGLIFGARDNTNIWAFSPTGTGWADTSHALVYTNISQGLVFSNDILYVPYDNKLASNDNGSWSDTALTIPTNFYITSICDYGNFVAVGAAPLSGVGNSKVFLWVPGDASWTQVIDWGNDNLQILDVVDGTLVGISFSGGTPRTRTTERVVFRYLSGTTAIKFQELLAGDTGTQLPIAKQRVNNRIHFMMRIHLNGAVREGVWSVGHSEGRLVVVHERTPNNDTPTAGTLSNFIYVGDYLFQSYTDGSANFQLTKTDDVANFTATSIYESTINPELPEHIRGAAGARSSLKKLYAVALSYTPLTSAQTVVLYYRVEGGAWVKIFSEATVGQVTTERTFDFNGLPFTDAREYEFRIESTFGAEITELKYKYDPIVTVL